jgi:PAS domain S-box-containing protein
MNNQDLHVLLIDDDEDDAIIIKTLLGDIQRVNLNFHWAATYEQGIAWLNQGHWTAILVDYDLGLKKGLEFIREAKAKEAQAPMIMVTGRGRYEIDLEAMQAGAADYISKDELNSSLLERTIRYANERRRVEEDLEYQVWERTRELQLLLDQTPAILWLVSPDLRITSVRGKGLGSIGLAADDLIGKTLLEAFTALNPADEKKMMAAHQQALQGQAAEYEIELGGVYLNTRVEPFRDQGDKIVGCIGTAFDISERKSAEEAQKTSLALFEGLFEASPDAVLLVSTDGMIQMNNRQAEVIFGYTRQEFSRLPVEQLIPERFRGNHPNHRAHYQANPRTRPMGVGLALFGMHKDHHEFPVDVSLSPLLVNRQTYMICVVRDLSER